MQNGIMDRQIAPICIGMRTQMPRVFFDESAEGEV